MDLTETQQAALRSWVAEGADLSSVQSRLKEEFDLSLTYMDTRFLLGDLALELAEDKEDAEPEPAAENDTPPATDTPAPAKGTQNTPPDPSPDDPLPGAGGAVTVTVDQIAQAHAIVSGTVTFSDGESAAWYLDQMGQLGLDPRTEGYQPPQEDVATFQLKLQKVLQEKDF